MIGSDRRATIRAINQGGKCSDGALRDGSQIQRVPGNKLPGYDHAVPPGQNPTNPGGYGVIGSLRDSPVVPTGQSPIFPYA